MLRFLLERLQALDVIAWVEEPGAFHLTVGREGEAFMPLYEALIEDQRPLVPYGPHVSLALDPTRAHAGDTLQLTLENFGDTRLEYSGAYRLEQRVGDHWRWINRDALFRALLQVIEAGKTEQEEIQMPDNLEPGRYRVVRSFSPSGADWRLRASAPFMVD